MTVATISPTTTGRTAVDIASAAQAATGGGDFFATTGLELLYIKNGDGSDHTLTVAIPRTVDGQSVASRTYTLTAGHSYLIGPFAPNVYADASGNVPLTYSAVTTVTVAVVKPGSA